MVFRKITNKGGVKKYIGLFPSFTLGKTIWYEGHYERDYLHLLEFDFSDVLNVIGQPCRFYYSVNGKRRRYTPDFLVVRRNKKQIVEVKPKKKAEQEKYQIPFKVAFELSGQNGYEFLVVTEFTIYRQPRLDNIKRLLHYQRVPIYPQHQILCYEFFAGKPEASLGEAMDFFQMKGMEQPVVCALLRWGILNVNLDLPLTPDSLITLPSDNANESKAA
jgi:hypothetical protein